jgi:hypothetical protein
LSLGALGVAPGVAAASQAGSVTHSAGGVSATVQWEGDQSDSLGVAHPQLWIERAGVRYDITVDDICGTGCILLADDATTKPTDSILKVLDLDGDGEPEVLLDTFSGGAHCCLTTRLLSWNGTGYTPTDESWRDTGYVLKDADADGRFELVGFDPRFIDYFVSAHAASSEPALVLRVDKGAFVDVTRSFPKVIASDAKSQLKYLRSAEKHREYDVRGLLAAYVADLYNLERTATAKAELNRQVRRHRITKKFRSHLLRQLRAWGYPVP